MNGAGIPSTDYVIRRISPKRAGKHPNFGKNNIDGIILSLSQDARDITYLKKVIEKNIHFVQFNRVNYKLDTPKIVFEDYKWAYIVPRAPP